MSSCETRQNIQTSHIEFVRAAVLAPTPDNNQPWRFVSERDRLLVYLDPKRALPSDVHSMFDRMGVGAAIENAAIAARQMGWQTEVEYPVDVPGAGEDDAPVLVATLRFHSGAEPDPLHGQLASRCTNRKLYSARPIDDAVLAKVARQAQELAGVRWDWITDRRRVRSFAKLIAVSDRLRFEYQPFHEELFRQIRFSPDEAEKSRDGLDVRTLELPAGAAAILRWLRSWPRMRRLNRLGLSRLLTLPSWLSVCRSGALGVLSVPEPSPAAFLQGGRALQRAWLAATREGLALQPLGSLAIFLGQMEQLDGRNLHEQHRKLSGRLKRSLCDLVPSVEGRTLLMVVRLGHASPPRVRSLRRPTESVFHSSQSDA